MVDVTTSQQRASDMAILQSKSLRRSE